MGNGRQPRHKSVDGTHPRKELVEMLTEPLLIIYQQSRLTEEDLGHWRSPNVTPIYQKGQKKDQGSDCPSLLSTGETTSKTLFSVGSLTKRRTLRAGVSPEKVTELGKGLENKYDEEQLRELGKFQSGERSLKRDLLVLCNP
ncbi:hypothetical protein TURU_083692 [Turdus rufiventris]|nr:hypothetical protein TURU_083692 [Turdus rufiventris]